MRIISLDNKLDTVTIGVIGSEKQGEELKARVLAMCPEACRERIVFLVPKDGVSPETMINGAAKTSRGGAMVNTIWLGCMLPETLPENVVWPSGILFVADYIDTSSEFFATLGFVPRFITSEELSILISETIKREIDSETVDMELATLRAEKFRLNKQIAVMEKAIENAGRTVSNINAVWRSKTMTLKLLFVILFILSSVLFAWLGFGVYNPKMASRILYGVHKRTFNTMSMEQPVAEKGVQNVQNTIQEAPAGTHDNNVVKVENEPADGGIPGSMPNGSLPEDSGENGGESPVFGVSEEKGGEGNESEKSEAYPPAPIPVSPEPKKGK